VIISSKTHEKTLYDNWSQTNRQMSNATNKLNKINFNKLQLVTIWLANNQKIDAVSSQIPRKSEAQLNATKCKKNAR